IALSLTANTAGIDCTRKAAATCGLSSMLTLTSSTRSRASSTTFSRTGPSCLQGPHHGAHRSMTTVTSAERSITSVWNVASVTSETITENVTLPGAGYFRELRFVAMPDIEGAGIEGITVGPVTEWLRAHLTGLGGALP